MPELDPSAYYLRREQQERALASGCIDPGIAAIHIELADRYGTLLAETMSGHGEAEQHTPGPP